MAQVTIYIDDELETKMRMAAKEENLSQSKWVTRIIREKLQNEWPVRVISLAGAWLDIPEAEEIRASLGNDSQREQL